MKNIIAHIMGKLAGICVNGIAMFLVGKMLGVTNYEIYKFIIIWTVFQESLWGAHYVMTKYKN